MYCTRFQFVLIGRAALLSLFLLSPLQAEVSAGLEQSLQQIFVSKDFKPDSFGPARWIEDGAAYTTLEKAASGGEGKDIVRYETASGARTILVSAAELIPTGSKLPLAIDDYAWSPDRAKLLIFTNAKPVWRRKTRGDYWLLDIRGKSLRKLGGDGEPSSMKFGKISPDGENFAFVRGNNLFVQNLASEKIRQLTHDGSKTIINGTSDWVYEEELDVRDGFRWSPDSKRIAFWHFDSSGVGDYPLVNYTDTLYPTIREIPYPKAGTTNSAVTVCVVDVRGKTAKWMKIPGDPRNNYIARMEWAGNSTELAIEQLNRLQNTAQLFLAEAATGVARSIFTDRDKAWVDVNEILPFGKDFLWLSERDGWRHAYLVRRDGGEPKLITPGEFDVIDLLTSSEKEKAVYFIASPENATQRYLYRASLAGAASSPVRVTPAAQTGIHTYDISPDAQWAFHSYSRFDDPSRMELIRLAGHEAVRNLFDNAKLRAKAQGLLANKSEFLKVDVGNGVTLDGMMIKPRDFDATRKYPVLVYVYGEPAAQTVLDEWMGSAELFHRALAEDGYIVVTFDNRGTPAPKGREWRKVIYGSVGPLATAEQTAAIQQLCREHSYLDANRIAVWGWSGGGTDTLNLMFRSPTVYKVGMAVAPVPDQRLYDTVYQERYMGLPQDNTDGYKRGSAINFAAGLKGNLLLVHGTGDDNVHFQGSQRLINKFVELGKQFDFMEYPNRTHAINEGEGTTIHLYTLLARYLEEHLPAAK